MSKEFTIDDAAKKMDRTPATMRGLFRRHKIEKAGKAYIWPSLKAMEGDLKKLEKLMDSPKASTKKVAVKKKAATRRKKEAEASEGAAA